MVPYIKDNGNVSLEEIYKVYNCGIGYVLIVDPEILSKIQKIFRSCNYWKNKINLFINAIQR